MRVNIEEEAWKRIYKMADFTGFTVRDCAGTVAALWANSQELVRVSGSTEEIIEWADLFKLPREESEKYIIGLEKVRFISHVDNSSFLIHGNQKQLESIASKANRASKGGKALQKKMRELKALKAGSKQASGGQQEAKRGSMQCNSMQDNAMQFNSNQSNAVVLVGTAALSVPAKAVPQKIKRETIQVYSFKDFDHILSHDVKANYYALYPDFEFLKREFLKMHNWLIANPKKNKKTVPNWIKFVSGWLDKGWPKYQNSLPSNKADQTTVALAEVDDRIRKLFESEVPHAS